MGRLHYSPSRQMTARFSFSNSKGNIIVKFSELTINLAVLCLWQAEHKAVMHGCLSSEGRGTIQSQHNSAISSKRNIYRLCPCYTSLFFFLFKRWWKEHFVRLASGHKLNFLFFFSEITFLMPF